MKINSTTLITVRMFKNEKPRTSEFTLCTSLGSPAHAQILSLHLSLMMTWKKLTLRFWAL